MAFLHFAGYLAARNAGRLAEKEANGLDPEMLAEINREREACLAARRMLKKRSCCRH
ncbi:hypothetical protein ACLB1E_29385 [Escherichia coli]